MADTLSAGLVPLPENLWSVCHGPLWPLICAWSESERGEKASAAADAIDAAVRDLMLAYGAACADAALQGAGPATTDELMELTAHLERMRAQKIIADVDQLAAKNDPDTMSPHWAGWSSACDEVAHRLKTEAWGLQPGGGWGPTGAANEDDRPSKNFGEQLQAVLGAQGAPVQAVPLTHMQIVLLWGHRSDGPSTAEIASFARAIERAHGITGDKPHG